MTTRTLRLAKDLTLPLDAVTQTIAILAKRRAGKSYTMRRLIEQLLHAGQQVVIVDPKGDQWGIRSAADGKAPGLPIVILGGERGDVPLESSSGEVVAKLVVEERVSVLLDLSLFRKHEVATFMTAFLENLYRLKAKEIYRTPVMLVVDEADAVAPQKPQKGEERMLGAAEDIVRRGGQRGIGCVLVTQRSAVLNKNVLTQAQMLIVLRTIAPQDLAAMKAWIDVHGDAEQGRILMESLPSLPVGDAWFWSPGWPTTDGIFKRVHVLPIETFDSGASPKPGVKPVEPKNLADVDHDALKGQMAATIEKAKADDPRELRKQIAELKKQLGSKVDSPAPVAAKETRVDVLTDADRARIDKLIAATNKIAADMGTGLQCAEQALRVALQDVGGDYGGACICAAAKAENQMRALLDGAGVKKILGKLATVETPSNYSKVITNDRKPLIPRDRPAAATSRPASLPPSRGDAGDTGLTRAAERRALTALVQYSDGRSARQVAILAGYALNGGGFRNAIGRLRALGYIDGSSERLRATQAGVDALGEVEPLPTGAALADHWLRQLDRKAEREILQVLLDAYPDALTAEQVAEKTPTRYEANGGGFRNALGKLRTLELVTGRGELRASEELF